MSKVTGPGSKATMLMGHKVWLNSTYIPCKRLNHVCLTLKSIYECGLRDWTFSQCPDPQTVLRTSSSHFWVIVVLREETPPVWNSRSIWGLYGRSVSGAQCLSRSMSRSRETSVMLLTVRVIQLSGLAGEWALLSPWVILATPHKAVGLRRLISKGEVHSLLKVVWISLNP